MQIDRLVLLLLSRYKELEIQKFRVSPVHKLQYIIIPGDRTKNRWRVIVPSQIEHQPIRVNGLCV